MRVSARGFSLFSRTSEHLAGDTQECNAPVVITLRAATLLVKGDDDVVEQV